MNSNPFSKLSGNPTEGLIIGNARSAEEIETTGDNAGDTLHDDSVLQSERACAESRGYVIDSAMVQDLYYPTQPENSAALESQESDDPLDSYPDLPDTKVLDPHGAALEYILENCPEAQYAGVGDDDLYRFGNALSDWANFPSVLREIKPAVILKPYGVAVLEPWRHQEKSIFSGASGSV